MIPERYRLTPEEIVDVLVAEDIRQGGGGATEDERNSALADAAASKAAREALKDAKQRLSNAGWLRPEECKACQKQHDQEVALNERSCMAAEGWMESGDVQVAIQNAVAKALKDVGEWLSQKQEPDEMWVKVWEDDVNRLKLGHLPASLRSKGKEG